VMSNFAKRMNADKRKEKRSEMLKPFDGETKPKNYYGNSLTQGKEEAPAQGQKPKEPQQAQRSVQMPLARDAAVPVPGSTIAPSAAKAPTVARGASAATRSNANSPVSAQGQAPVRQQTRQAAQSQSLKGQQPSGTRSGKNAPAKDKEDVFEELEKIANGKKAKK